MKKKDKIKLVRIIAAFCLFVVVMVTDKAIGLTTVSGGGHGWLLPFGLYLTVYILIGYDVLWRAVRNIAHGSIFDENFLMCLASLCAFGLAIYSSAGGGKTEGFDEACAVLIFYQVGEFFESYATGRARKSVSALMDIRPDYANVYRDGEILRSDPSQVSVGEIITVYPGEKVPLDGVVVKGATSLDVRALTGESQPKDVSENFTVLSGSVNMTSQIDVRVEKEFYDSTVSKILNLVENAAARKAKTENFITRFAKYYTPAVVLIAAMVAVVPSLITGAWSVWIYRALSLLVVSCPCALVISIPLSFFAGIGAASRYGILIKGSNYLELMARANLFVFDKTGTLTEGNFEVAKIVPQEKADEILRLAAIAESGLSHPIARSVLKKYGTEPERGYILTECSGKGVIAERGGHVIYCGNEKLMEEKGVPYVPENDAGTIIYVAENGKYIGSLLITDTPRKEAGEVITKLNAERAKTVMLTGDNPIIARSVAAKLGVSDFKASLLPQDKVDAIEKFGAEDKNNVICFVGDGINDAPVLMRSDVGVAMGGVGSDAATEAADVVLMKDDLSGILRVRRIARKTLKIVFENILFSIAIKAGIMLLSAIGITNMWFAVFGDVGVSVLAILNAMRVNSKY